MIDNSNRSYVIDHKDKDHFHCFVGRHSVHHVLAVKRILEKELFVEPVIREWEGDCFVELMEFIGMKVEEVCRHGEQVKYRVSKMVDQPKGLEYRDWNLCMVPHF